MSGDFEALLDSSFEAVPEPKPIPVGTWKLKGVAAKTKEGTTAEDANKVMFVYKPVEPQEDVDEDEVAAEDWKGESCFQTFDIAKASDMKQVERHLAKHGISTEGTTIKKALAEFTKKKPEVYAEVSHRGYTDKNTGEPKTATNLRNFVAVGA